MANNSSDYDCFEMFSAPKYIALLAVRNTLSFVSCCILLCVIGLIVLFQKHMFMSQRLVLYLALSSAIFSLVQVFNFDAHTANRSQENLNYCIAIGFLTQVTIWWELVATSCIMIDIFLKAVFQAQTEKLEKFYVLFIIVTPFVFSWIPFVKGHYGPAGLYCWIRDRNLENCMLSSFGNWLRFSMYYIPLYTIMTILVSLVIISLVTVHWRKKKWVGDYSPQSSLVHQMIEKEIRPLVWYPLIFLLINIVPLIRRAYSVHDKDETFFFVLTAIQVVVYRFQGILIGLAFALDPETRKKLNLIEIRASLARYCSNRHMIEDYPVENGLSDSKDPYSDPAGLLTPKSPLVNTTNSDLSVY